jgi:hypothetical protein
MKGTLKPFLILAGLYTAIPLVLVCDPTLVTKLFKMPYNPDYGMFIQHWGLMVGLAGLGMVAAAFRPRLRTGVMAFIAAEKLGMGVLFVLHRGQPFAEGFAQIALIDAAMAVYCLVWLATCRCSE